MSTGFNDLSKSVRGAGRELDRFNDRNGDDRPGGYGTGGGGGSIKNEPFDKLMGRPPTAEERQALANGLTPMDVFAGGSLAVRNANIKGSPSVMQQNTGPLSLVPQYQTREELDAWWKQWQNQYAQDNPFSVKSSGALGNYQYDLTQFAVNQAGRAIDLQQAAANARPKPEAERKPSAPSPVPQAPAAAPAPAAPQSVITHRHEVVIGGRQYNVGTDAAGSSEMQQLMAALERDAKLSGGVH